MTCHCLERESKLSLCLSLLGSSRRGSWERGWHIPTLQASARANPLPSRIIRCHGNFLDMVLNSSRPDGSLFTVENIPARINLINPDQTWNFIPYTVSSTGCSKKHPVHQWAQLFEGRLALNLGLNLYNPGFFFLCSKAFSWIIFSVIFRASNHQLVDKKN